MMRSYASASNITDVPLRSSVTFLRVGNSALLPDRLRSNPQQFIHGIPWAFLVLGGMTILSMIVFCERRD
jgi:hypothetical protein